MPLSHAQLWKAVDRLAARQGMTASGLARRAGLDATSFNPSKRFGPGDPPRPRWPSTESVAKVLEAAEQAPLYGHDGGTRADAKARRL